ncbi:hypothetical protein [Nocardioides sp. LML1-1-1.1]|uniref:hypothetical protein n=1 Tax=Nocardioides sp. LML1-1-1.1 TaxID=3135248 RepID=UPI0034349CD6
MIPELAGYTPAALATASPKGLALVEERISAVIKTIDYQMDVLDEVDFPVKGHIGKQSFGGGGHPALLALHHARAHGVVTTTLKDLRSDLVKFRTAIREARTLLKDKDEQARADVATILQRTEDLDLGTQARPEAQVQHANDVATDEPVPAGAGTTGTEEQP